MINPQLILNGNINCNVCSLETYHRYI